LAGYPVNLLVNGRRCVVVGGGRIAARKIEALRDAGADVHVVALDTGDEVRRLRDQQGVHVDERAFVASDLDGAWLATTATDDPAVNRAVFEAAEARHVWCNSADDPANCSFTLMSVIRQATSSWRSGRAGAAPRSPHG
jgi:precorrin-2 dehydrogenase/sirohydrochlorin ferrochelatase